MMTQENIPYTADEIKAMVKTIESLRKTQKKYQDALEKVKGLLKDQEMALHAREKLANVFPELAESEDERIRKDIISYLRNEKIVKRYISDIEIDKWIAWIEKQSKKKSADEVLKIRQEVYQSGYNDGYKHGQEDITKSLSIGENINHTDIKEKAHQIAWETSKDYDPSLSKEAWCEMAALDMASWLKREVDDAYLQGICDAKHEIEKQGEQKPTKDIVETWKDMRLEVYQQASGNRHEPNYSDDTTKMFSLNDIDEIIEKISEQSPSDNVEPKTLNADKVIKWLNNQACLGWIEDVEVDKFVEKFKEDFNL